MVLTVVTSRRRQRFDPIPSSTGGRLCVSKEALATGGVKPIFGSSRQRSRSSARIAPVGLLSPSLWHAPTSTNHRPTAGVCEESPDDQRRRCARSLACLGGVQGVSGRRRLQPQATCSPVHGQNNAERRIPSSSRPMKIPRLP